MCLSEQFLLLSVLDNKKSSAERRLLVARMTQYAHTKVPLRDLYFMTQQHDTVDSMVSNTMQYNM